MDDKVPYARGIASNYPVRNFGARNSLSRQIPADLFGIERKRLQHAL